jgi:hypothetical protein
MIGALLENGKKPTQLLRINLEEPLFDAEYSIEFLEQIYRLHREKIPPSGWQGLFGDAVIGTAILDRLLHH